MDGFDIYVALLSFVFALGLTQLLQSAADLWLARDRVRFSPVLALWMFLSFLLITNNWLALAPLAEAEWTMDQQMANFITAIVQYFTCALVGPRPSPRGAMDMVAYERRHGGGIRMAYLLLVVCVLIINAVQFEDWAGQAFDPMTFLIISAPVILFGVFVAVGLWIRGTVFTLVGAGAFAAYIIVMMSGLV